MNEEILSPPREPLLSPVGARAAEQEEATARTPGPWDVMMQNLRRVPCDRRCPEMWQVPVTNGNVVAMVYGSTISGQASKEECLANAQLIAAAPDLLAAAQECERLLLEYGDAFSGSDQEAMGKVRKAVAKANGKPVARNP